MLLYAATTPKAASPQSAIGGIVHTNCAIEPIVTLMTQLGGFAQVSSL
ncbi:hypothetical protein [Sphingopyxis sp. YF1]|nr:hypothetical protein [Sphingopyxis sp. YF1]